MLKTSFLRSGDPVRQPFCREHQRFCSIDGSSGKEVNTAEEAVDIDPSLPPSSAGEFQAAALDGRKREVAAVAAVAGSTRARIRAEGPTGRFRDS